MNTSPIRNILMGVLLSLSLCLFLSCQKKMSALKQDGLLMIKYGQQDLLGYQFGVMMPPDTVDAAYQRSGFIHPLYSPKGSVLTRIQPPDHYHHYGLWNPWTHVEYRGDTIDFWNLAKEQGTVRFSKFLAESSARESYSFTVRHEHVVFGEAGKETIPLEEIQQITVYRPQAKEHYTVDFRITYEVQGNDPVKLLEYRYGGFGWRTTEEWDNQNSEVITSAGLSRKEADGSVAKWCIVQGKLGDDYGGVLLMSHPENYNHPEPLRIWPSDQYGRGDLFVNFATTKNTDWLLAPDKKYTLQYRLVIYNDPMSPDRAAQLWEAYAHPTEADHTIQQK